jgi:hypothetical protein
MAVGSAAAHSALGSGRSLPFIDAGLLPELAGGLARIDAGVLPPGGFVADAVANR